MDRGRVGEDRGSKETDGCPLTVWRVVGLLYAGSHQLLHNLTDMRQKASACIGLCVGMVPESYHCTSSDARTVGL
jgi:hypothetical protein